MDISLFGQLFTINIGRSTVAVNVPEIIFDKSGLSILAHTWIGFIYSPTYQHRYFSFCILGFGIGVQIRERGEGHV